MGTDNGMSHILISSGGGGPGAFSQRSNASRDSNGGSRGGAGALQDSTGSPFNQRCNRSSFSVISLPPFLPQGEPTLASSVLAAIEAALDGAMQRVLAASVADDVNGPNSHFAASMHSCALDSGSGSRGGAG